MMATRTLNAPSSAIAPLRIAMTANSRRSWITVRRPAASSGARPCRRGTAARLERARVARASGRTASVDPSGKTAIVAYTAAGPARPTSRPTRSGPIKAPNPSTVPDAAFATASSSGVWATSGSSAACAGRIRVMLVAAKVATAYAMIGGARTSATAVAAIEAARIPYAPVSTRARGHRSPNIDAAGATMIDGMNTTPATTPASTAPPRA
jgi:hypothetical protein